MGALIALLIASCSFPASALAGDGKTALPSIQKFVSLDGRAYSGEVTTAAGSTVKYRLVMTMPECVGKLEMLDYVAHDKPNARIEVDASSVRARIVDEEGSLLATLAPTPRKSAKKFTIELGDLKAVYPDLKFGDCVVVDYDATVQGSAPAGTYPNIAKLVYDMGEGPDQTAEVEAKVNVPADDEPDVVKKKLPTTGDGLSAAGLAGIAVMSCSIAAFAYARLRRQ